MLKSITIPMSKNAEGDNGYDAEGEGVKTGRILEVLVGASASIGVDDGATAPACANFRFSYLYVSSTPKVFESVPKES